MKVRITAGMYGYLEKGVFKAANKGSTVDVDDAEALRLYDLGVAEAVNERDAIKLFGVSATECHFEDAHPSPKDGIHELTEGAENGEGDSAEDIHVPSKEELEAETVARLKEIAAEYGVSIKGLKSKAEIVAAILADTDDDPDDGELPPVPSADGIVI